MKKILTLHKERGETPLSTIDRFRLENPEYKDVKMTYAGRLDPLASGVLLVLVGDECKNKKKYTDLDKEYVFEVLFGFETDTFDVLGKCGSAAPYRGCTPFALCRRDAQGLALGALSVPLPSSPARILPDALPKLTSLFIGKMMQQYPPYSSKTVSGKALFQWAREERLDEIEIPEREIEIYNLDFLYSRTIEKDQLHKEILETIDLVKGDFRQNEIKECWEKTLQKSKEESFLIASFRIHCSSGTYVRSIAKEMGRKLGCGAVAWSIERVKVG